MLYRSKPKAPQEEPAFSFSHYDLDSIPDYDVDDVAAMEARLKAIVEAEYDDEGVEEWIPTLPNSKPMISKPEPEPVRKVIGPRLPMKAPEAVGEATGEVLEEPIQSLTLEENVAPEAPDELVEASMDTNTNVLSTLDYEVKEAQLRREKLLAEEALRIEEERISSGKKQRRVDATATIMSIMNAKPTHYVDEFPQPKLKHSKPDNFIRKDKFKGSINARGFDTQLSSLRQHKKVSADKDVDDFISRINRLSK